MILVVFDHGVTRLTRKAKAGSDQHPLQQKGYEMPLQGKTQTWGSHAVLQHIPGALRGGSSPLSSFPRIYAALA